MASYAYLSRLKPSSSDPAMLCVFELEVMFDAGAIGLKIGWLWHRARMRSRRDESRNVLRTRPRIGVHGGQLACHLYSVRSRLRHPRICWYRVTVSSPVDIAPSPSAHLEFFAREQGQGARRQRERDNTFPFFQPFFREICMYVTFTVSIYQ